jgi:hypothetical protein
MQPTQILFLNFLVFPLFCSLLYIYIYIYKEVNKIIYIYIYIYIYTGVNKKYMSFYQVDCCSGNTLDS